MLIIALHGHEASGVTECVAVFKKLHIPILDVGVEAKDALTVINELICQSIDSLKYGSCDSCTIVVGLNDNVKDSVLRRLRKCPFAVLVDVQRNVEDLWIHVQSLLEDKENNSREIIHQIITQARVTPDLVLEYDSRSSVSVLEEICRECLARAKDCSRPGWDLYFMRLAYMAASRTNCVKRRVGACIVKDNRLVSAGYNGTPFGILNCNKGGCGRCMDSTVKQGVNLESCLCIHAEMNALLECGRGNTQGATMYVTTCPCLGCAKLIIQSGIRRVLYMENYDPSRRVMELLNENEIECKMFTPGCPLGALASHLPF